MRYIRIVKYLDGLNEAQKRAVLATDGPVSVLAGAGAGKTRVLTTRIYHLVRVGVQPARILAVTFTNKAAREMRERVRAMLDLPDSRLQTPDSRVPFIATFHGLGRELLESYGSRIGIPRYFSVYDRDDSERAVSAALKQLDVSTKEVSPRAVLSRISRAKGEGMTAEAYRAAEGRASFAARTTAEVWRLYEQRLTEEKALDFDDLIAKPVRLLENFPDAREAAAARWEYLHIDEYQDTNALQGRLASLLAEKHKNIFVVGDIDQCLTKGTRVAMADGSQKCIEAVKKGDQVLSNYGSGDMRPARISRVLQKVARKDLVRITTHTGRTLVSTPDHIHFAGYRLGETPQLYFTYLMHKKSRGWRLGVSQTYTRGQVKPMIGFQQRCNQEHADAVWVVGTFPTSQEARVCEYQLSLSYGIPTLPFVARKGAQGGYVHDQKVLDSIFASFDTEASARRLLADRGLLRAHPHHRAQASSAVLRRNITIALCGEHRGSAPLHRISCTGSDEEGSAALRAAGFSVRTATVGSASWRFETAHKNYGEVETLTEALLRLFPDATVVRTARLGGQKKNPKDGNSLPFTPAGSVLPGMAVFAVDGSWDIVERIERIPHQNAKVYDLDVERTHNFVANGIVTHNCIYTWRGATIENLLEFDRHYPEAQTIVLEENYRSTENLVAAANRVIEKNVKRKEKRSTTRRGPGEPIRVHIAVNAEDEARWIAEKVRHLMRKGESPEDIAVLFRTNFQSRALEEGFLRAGVPYRLLGTHFFARKEVKDVLAWLRLTLDPSRAADRVRAAGAPSRGLGKITLAKLATLGAAGLRGAERARVEAFGRLVAELSQAAETLAPSEFVKLVIEKSGMRRALYEEGSAEDRERFENVEELATVAARHDAVPGREGIAAFLTEAALASDQDEMDLPAGRQVGRGKASVTLMTVHAAKGLEFNTVFVSGLEEGLFPHEDVGGRPGGHERDEEEERRLFYVAITRAKSRLYLTLARVRKLYGADYLSEPSSFLADLSGDIVYDESNGEEIIEA